MKKAKFKNGDHVIVSHQKELGIFEVINSKKKTDMTIVGSNIPVEFYVVLNNINNHNLTNQGYHQENLIKV